MSRQPRVDLHIESLVLVGFPALDRARVGETVQAELIRLLVDGRAAAALGGRDTGAIPRLDAGSFTAVPGASAEVLGASIARALHAGLARGPEPVGGGP